MTDAEIIRACAARFTVWHAPAHVIVNDLLRIADRLEKIDAAAETDDGSETCPTCSAVLYPWYVGPDAAGNYAKQWPTCWRCSGSGRIPTTEKREDQDADHTQSR